MQCLLSLLSRLHLYEGTVGPAGVPSRGCKEPEAVSKRSSWDSVGKSDDKSWCLGIEVRPMSIWQLHQGVISACPIYWSWSSKRQFYAGLPQPPPLLYTWYIEQCLGALRCLSYVERMEGYSSISTSSSWLCVWVMWYSRKPFLKSIRKHSLPCTSSILILLGGL